MQALEVTDAAQLSKLARVLKDESDVLINNAGVGGGESTEDWLHTLHVNAIAPVRIAQALLPMLTRGRGKVIASSIHGEAKRCAYVG